MKSQGTFSQQSEGSPHLLQLNAVNALICLLWRLKVLGLIRQENKCCNFHQQSQDVLPQNSHRNQWKCLHTNSPPACGLHMGHISVTQPAHSCTQLAVFVQQKAKARVKAAAGCN